MTCFPRAEDLVWSYVAVMNFKMLMQQKRNNSMKCKKKTGRGEGENQRNNLMKLCIFPESKQLFVIVAAMECVLENGCLCCQHPCFINGLGLFNLCICLCLAWTNTSSLSAIISNSNSIIIINNISIRKNNDHPAICNGSSSHNMKIDFTALVASMSSS